MRSGDLTALAPLLATAATAIVVMLAIAWRRSHRLTVILTLAGLAAALAALGPAWRLTPRHVTTLLVVDPYALLYGGSSSRRRWSWPCCRTATWSAGRAGARSSTCCCSWRRSGRRCWRRATTSCRSSSGWSC